MLISLCFLFIRCTDDYDDKEYGKKLYLSGPVWDECDQTTNTADLRESIRIRYLKDKTIGITHLNADYNCCMERLHTLAYFNNDTITLKETSYGDACNCICPYKIDYNVRSIRPGKYMIRLVKNTQIAIHPLDLTDSTDETIELEWKP